MRVVLDANVFVSSMISKGGSSAAILRLWKQGAFDLLITPSILEELKRVIHYPSIQKRYPLPEAYILGIELVSPAVFLAILKLTK